MTPTKTWWPYLYAAIALLLFCTPAGAEMDKTKYISIGEIRTDMEAYCLTVWYGTEIEKFPLKILSVVRNQKAEGDMILVLGTDERFKNASAVHGCSGSPVFIDNRLAGALAAGWDGSLESLYLVRPIEDMLEVGTGGKGALPASAAGLSVMDVREPMTLAGLYTQAARILARPQTADAMTLPLTTSLPAEVCRSLAESFDRLGVSPLPAGAATFAADPNALNVPIERGSVLAAVLCSGDITLASTGTTTEVVGDTVYAFGHSFTGTGPVEFPMAAGKIHTVIAGRDSSFKLSSPGPIVGTIQFDQSAAVRGQIGVMPKMVPMRVTVQRYNDAKTRTYNCQLAFDRHYTPMIGQVVASSAVLMQGALPPEHTLRYRGQIAVSGGKTIAFENISSGNSASDVSRELLSTLTMLLNNPFELVAPEEIELNVSIEPQDQTAEIWSARLSQATVKPGQTITAEVVLQSFRAVRTTCSVELKIPETLPPGKYPLQLLGAEQYENFVSKNAPQRFRVVDAASLVEGLGRVLNMPRNRLYAVLQVPSTGLTLRRHELPNLPPTRMNLLQDAKRLQPLEPYKGWVENNIVLDKIIAGAAQIELTVEQPQS